MKIKFTINGEERTCDVNSTTRLLDVIRDDLKLTGTKEGCGKGECGACTVIMNDKLVTSCLVLAYQAEGADIITIEGLVKDDEMHPVQVAFIETGAVQCGFCTPGFILATKKLLDENPNPTEEEIKRGLSGNICRCTGYKKIIDAVKLASRKFLETKRGEEVEAE
ncbi:(2Fe-2S)-binding protein [Petrotoga sp. 9PWA.NaAc.5.4]|uniref:(2Fe-2S)-binding protein n=1 Tax=Petrotoga sp. 9PWA.NaAc.5.4 TaxID=1434328 RepID=UPI000CAF3BA8|nr:(2Fe-2S)-binding protein [Petrotoga sp. 9PWA.NaAc.5.4]PNR96659.1 (2Fe-2S)-binding protein [Petrotoga sp. 9PWA.NaAc.5.4]